MSTRANIIMALIPFTKIAHCILMPMSQAVIAVGWKFPAGAGTRVIETLDYAPVWQPQARTAAHLADSKGAHA